jgi:hypothetical protein
MATTKLTTAQAAALRWFAHYTEAQRTGTAHSFRDERGARFPRTDMQKRLRAMGLVDGAPDMMPTITDAGLAALGIEPAAEPVQDEQSADATVDRILAAHPDVAAKLAKGQARDAAEQQATQRETQRAAISTDEQLRDRLLAGGASPERAALVVAARNQLQRELTAAAPAIARALEDEPHPHPCPCGCHLGPAPDLTVERCRQPLAGTGGEPCQAPAGHDGRGHDATGQPWSHCTVLERDHADALEEDAAHDAAVAAAIPQDTYQAAELLADRLVQGVPMFEDRDLTTKPLTPTELQQVELATNLAGQTFQLQHRQLPRALRYGAGRLTLVPPR